MTITTLTEVDVTIEDTCGRIVEYADCGYAYDGSAVEILMNGGCELWPLTSIRKVAIDYSRDQTDAA